MGQRDDYWWLVGEVGPLLSWSFGEAFVSFHVGHRLAIAAFDSGPFHPGPEELDEGWSVRGQLAVSPELQDHTELPQAGFDEWYVFDEQSSPLWEPEVFVNFGSFTLVPVAELEAARDPTWERHALDWLPPVQERFWAQIAQVRPLSYIAIGEVDLVVTRNRAFAARLISCSHGAPIAQCHHQRVRVDYLHPWADIPGVPVSDLQASDPARTRPIMQIENPRCADCDAPLGVEALASRIAEGGDLFDKRFQWLNRARR